MIARSRLLGVTALAVVLCAAPAQSQQQFSWTNYCTVGSLQFCASVEMVLTPDASGSTTLMSIRMRNLQGTLGTIPWRMSHFYVLNLKTDYSSPYDFNYPMYPQGQLTGSAGFHLNIDPDECAELAIGGPRPCPDPFAGHTEWDRYQPPGTDRAVYFEWHPQDHRPNFIGDIVGCDAPFAPDSPGWNAPQPLSFQTCGDGWVGFSFTLPGTWEADGALPARWYAYSDQGSDVCVVDVNCFPSEVTPEPVTIVLLGSGLMGVGVFRRRKRAMLA